MRAYHLVSGVLFTIVGLAHLARGVLGWSMRIDTYEVSIAVSYGVFALCAAMAVWSFRALNTR